MPAIPAAASWLASARAALRPPPKMSLSEWADEHYQLSAESSASPGQWRTRAYQRGILDAITDPRVERVSVQKSARIGYTLCINAAIAYHMHGDPCSIMVVQPTVDTAKKYSKEFITPMLRDVPVLAGLVKGNSVKTSGRTLLDKSFPGGVLSMVGANSGTGFAMSSRRIAIFDEVDRYPLSAGDEGDPIALGVNRTREFWNRKIIAGSSPTVAGTSRIEQLFEAGDRRRFYVPCPHCAHMDYLTPREQNEGGHFMWWPKGEPDKACFRCRACGCLIEERHKQAMVDAGEWRGEGEPPGAAATRIHASFHIWAAYSMSPNATWGQIAKDFSDASKLGTEQLKTVINTLFGETWKERGEAPDWERLYQRREAYAIGTVPDGAIALTSGVDVQQDRLMWEVVAWDAEKRSSSVAIGCIMGDTALEAPAAGSPWLKLDELLSRTFLGAGAAQYHIAMMAIDSGFRTNVVYTYCRAKPANRVIAVKGNRDAPLLIGVPSKVDITVRGRRLQRGFQVYPVGTSVAKTELYGWLGLSLVEGVAPHGYCRFPEYDEEWFQQITAEQLVKIIDKRTKRAIYVWQEQPGRENHYLDCRVYARAAVALLGLDRLSIRDPGGPPQSANSPPARGTAPATAGAQAGATATRVDRPRSWLSGSRGRRGRRGGGWLG